MKALTMNASEIRINPSAKASSRLPLEVSSAMVVVITRVRPAMLPPTMITAPTSAIARPKPANKAVKMAKRASMIKVLSRNQRDASTLCNRGRYTCSNGLTASVVRVRIIGKINTDCAIIMAVGVNNRPYSPKGPARDSNRYMANPTTTGGKAIKDEVINRISRLPKKRPIARPVPKGIAKSAAIRVAQREIRKDSPTMPHKVASPEVIKRNVVLKISKWCLSG